MRTWSILLLTLFLNTSVHAALEYSKIEFDGCPENAYCLKETGQIRKAWLENLEQFSKGKLTADKFNSYLQKNSGLPVPGWAREEASITPRIVMWDSPCKQHRKEASKFYISEIFRKNLEPQDLKAYPNLYFSKAIGIDSDKKIFTVTIPRGDAPFYIKNNEMYFLREDEGHYYGLLISRSGNMRVTKVETITEPIKEGVCFKEQIDFFLRESPAPDFFQGYYCKDIWDKDEKKYRTLLFGWSCN